MIASTHAEGIESLGRGEFWRWRATIMRVVDGDTVEVVLDLGLGLTLRSVPNVSTTRVRLLGVDAPELSTTDGVNACRALVRLLFPATAGLVPPLDARVFVSSAALDKYGRILGTIDLPDGRSVIDEMTKLGWLRPYDGTGPRPWS